MASSSSSSHSPQTETCFNFITNLLITFKDTILNLFFHQQIPEEEVDQLSQPLPQAIASSSSLQMNKGKQLSQPLPQAIASSSSLQMNKGKQLSQPLPQTIASSPSLQMNIGKQLSQTIASSSSSSSRPMKYQVFLSFRGEDTRHNFTAHLRKALKDTGMNVFFDEEKLERGEQLSLQLSEAIAASNISVIILSKDYASSKSCLAELSDIMDCKDTQGHIVLPIFYHVDPSDVENIGGSFETSFQEHKSNRPVDEVKRWKTAFAGVGKLQGFVIGGGKFDRPETEHIKEIVDHVLQKMMKHQVFLSLDDSTRLGFTGHLLGALKKRGINVIFDNGTLDHKSEAIAASDLSIIVLSKEYASSKSCLDDISNIMGCKKQIGLPIFYHVDPSYVRNIGGSFKTSFEEHKSKWPANEVELWKSAFAYIGKLKGWHIEGCKFDRSEKEYIDDIVEDVIKKLKNKSISVSQGWAGIDKQKDTILELIEKKENRVIGLWGMGGIGKTTLAEAVYNEIALNFDSHCFVQNVRDKIENQRKDKETLRNELLTKLLKLEICIDTPSIGSNLTKKRLENTRVIVVLDDVDHLDQIECFGLKHFGEGSKIILTSRDRQVLEVGGADKIHEMKKLSDNNSLQLFSTFAFKLSNPASDFRDLSNQFVKYGQGSPLALRVLGSQLYKKSRKDWESEMEKLKEYGQPEVSKILRRSFDGLDKQEKSIFLDIACLHKGRKKEDLEEILNCLYKGVRSGIRNLLNKCLLDITPDGLISMHDKLGEMGKNIECEDNSKKRIRLWRLEDINELLRHNKWTNSVEGISLLMQYDDNRWLSPTVFQNIRNLKVLLVVGQYCELNTKLFAHQVDMVSLPDELRYLYWRYCPFKSLSSCFNPKNLVVLRLPSSEQLEHLWNEDHQDLVHLREINVDGCKKLMKIPTLLEATNLKTINVGRNTQIEELSKLPPYLRNLYAINCAQLKKVSFADQNLYQPDLLDDEDKNVIMSILFYNCISLNKDSVDNIVANAMLKIGSLAEIWARKYVANAKVFFSCCFPGDVIPENKFEYRSANSLLNLKIVPDRCGGNRFLGFAICLVVDLSLYNYEVNKCQCKLTIGGGGGGYYRFICDWKLLFTWPGAIGDHVLILFSEKMFKKDKDYDEALFQFYFTNDRGEVLDHIKVKKCGVHVLYKEAKLVSLFKSN